MLLIRWRTASSLLLAACASLHEAGASTLCVDVRDPGNMPLPDVTVAVTGLLTPWGRTVRAGLDGKVCLDDLPDGVYAVEASRAGFLHVRYHPVSVLHPDTTRLRFRLPFGELHEGGLRQEAVFSGTLEVRGVPAHGASVCLLEAGRNAEARCDSTNSLGQYAVLVPPGRYRYRIRYRSESHEAEVDAPVPGYYRNLLRFGTAQ